MIKDNPIALEVNLALQESYRVLEASVALVRERCSEEEIDDYLQGVGNVLHELNLQRDGTAVRSTP